MDRETIQKEVEKTGLLIRELQEEVGKVLVGQEYMLSRMLVAIFTGGHILLEGVPGLAKTTAVKTIASALDLQFSRIQFTPDLLPADLVGTEIYDIKSGSFTVKKGPVFTNVLLADEINRAPAKTQSALLEVMQEKQVTIGERTYRVEEPFLVMATQNPIEQEGTYPLPEAQVDRFMLKVLVTYPDMNEEREIVKRVISGFPEVRKVLDGQYILKARELIKHIHMDEKVLNYILSITFATREPERFNLGEIKSLVEYGASPRASIYMALGARALALIKGRAYVTPQDVKDIAPDVLRHRIILSYEGEAEGLSTDDIVKKVLDTLEVP